MDTNEGFRERLRTALTRRGMSQTELARRLSVRVATVNEWLNRGTMPSGAAMVRIPGILGADGHWLLTGETLPRGEAGAGIASDQDRERILALLEVARQLLAGETEAATTPALRVREAAEDERLALEAVERFRRAKSVPETSRRRRKSP